MIPRCPLSGLRRAPDDLWRRTALLGLSFTLIFGSNARAGDILRGGAPAGQRGAPTAFGTNPAPANQARNNAKDALSRTTQAVQSVQAMQAAARAAALAGPNNLGPDPNRPGQLLPNVPNGLAPGGLQVLPGVPANLATPQAGENAALWTGAELPVQSAVNGRTLVTVKQNVAQAVLNWQTLNVGKQTTLKFDQSAGKANKSQWIAFNKITDPSGSPTQILGNLEADGQVYVINQNGIIFGGSSQVNLRSLTASSLPINDNLIKQGLLNNRDAQFLFSSLSVPGGADGTPIYTPVAPLTPNGRQGDVVVQKGASLATPVSDDGNGGRIMLVGANVRNEGSISTPAGQTILAAGLQVGVAAHASDDPSLRGLDTWVGAVGDYAGTTTNSGLIETFTGSTLMTGRYVNQFGAIESTTSVSLNGRIDLLASYGAVGNPNFDNTGAGSGGPLFLYQHTGVVSFGAGSATRILPDYASAATVPGTSLPEKSQINVEGLAIHLGTNAAILAPNADVTFRAGVWPYIDADGNRTTLDATGGADAGLLSAYLGTTQRFFYSGGQIYLDPGAVLSVAGSTDVAVPLSQSILTLEFRGSELANSPLQRTGPLRAVDLTVDIRRTGVYGGRFWMGTSLGDATGAAGLIQRNAAQLTAVGGNVSLQAGGAIVVRKDAEIDVSGGFFRHEAGMVQTTRLLQNGRLVEIANARPDQVYQGIYNGQFTKNYDKYGITETYATPWMTGRHYEAAYTQGADGGSLSLTAPSMAIDGELRGSTIAGERQRALPPGLSKLSLTFEAEKILALPGGARLFLTNSPTPPAIIFADEGSYADPGAFRLAEDEPVPLGADRIASVILSPELLDEQGFGHLAIRNPDGNVTVPDGVRLVASPRGSISLTGANVTVGGEVTAPGGTLAFLAYNISPIFALEFPLVNPLGLAAPAPVANRGLFALGRGASLSTAGLIVDDRPGLATSSVLPLVTAGGGITIDSLGAELAEGGVIDVSGGVAMSARGVVSYGTGGTITIRTGRDPGFSTVLGGTLRLGSKLSGYAGGKGGSLALQAGVIQVGGDAVLPTALVLSPEFFRQGGFTNYALTGIGAPPTATSKAGSFTPGISIAPDIRIEPGAESWLAIPHARGQDEVVLRPFLKPAGLRSATSLSFTALGSDDQFTTGEIEVRGDVVMGLGSEIVTDAGASVSFKGQTVSLLGAVSAPGGTITVAGAGSFPVAPDAALNVTFARPTVYLGNAVQLSTGGTALLVPDAYGRRLGTLYPGGAITVTGNIVADAGAVLDVSGASTVFDLHPSQLGGTSSPLVPLNSGLNSPLASLRSVPVQMDSNGGRIDLQGSQMLFTDATLLGRPGGPTALGGDLSVFSGRFYPQGASRTSAEINLVVTQGGRTISTRNTERGIGVAVLDDAGAILTGMGYFTAERFMEGGFDSLDLGFKFLNAAPVAFGGNIEFKGAVSISAPGTLRVAAGGVIRADADVQLRSSHAVIGQPFLAPAHPNDQIFPFQQDPPSPTRALALAPVFGPGSLSVTADLIDIGNLSLQSIGRAAFTAKNGDIRGNGTLSMAGDLILRAGQIYPTSLSTFNVFAYDHAGGEGSVTIAGSGTRAMPLSAGGSLNIFASKITQGGVLRAPLGSITLGWDGSTDFDLSDADVDSPFDPVARRAVAVGISKTVTLQAGSLTSVSAAGLADDAAFAIPFGLSPDGSSWIDPRGVNITVTGLPEKRVVIAGGAVVAESGSTIDLRGGGDLSAFRWVPGPGGGVDLLGTASVAWSTDTAYAAGDLVTDGGQTWSARLSHTGQKPTSSLFWTLVPESYAVVPGFPSEFAPYAPFNTGESADALGGDPGFVSSTLSVGDQVYLESSPGLRAGTYTLLPRRYALLPGAFLVTPTIDKPIGTFTLPEGASYASGYRVNAFSHPQKTATLRTRFEVAPPDVLSQRAEYDLSLANAFFPKAAAGLNVTRTQRLPVDAGYLALHGNSALQAAGNVLTARPDGGRGSAIDVSSFASIYVVGGNGVAPSGAAVVLSGATLNSWGAESLLIGGVRRRTNGATVVEVRTSDLILDNPGASLSAPDVTLASRVGLTLSAGSSVVATGTLSEAADVFTITGNGALLRTAVRGGAAVTRTGVTSANTALLTVGAGGRIAGGSVTLDSTFGTNLHPTMQIEAQTLALNGGQISILFDPPSAVLTGSVVNPNHLTLSGQLLETVQRSQSLSLRSYRTIDFYGSGTFGSPGLGSLALSAAGIRGYDQAGGTVFIRAGDVLFERSADAVALAAPAATSGALQVEAQTVRLGANAFSVAGYSDVFLSATGGLLGEGAGSFTTPGNLTITAPVITGARGSSHEVTATGALVLERGGGVASVQGGLGAGFTFTGASVFANTDILLPSGLITLRARTGDVTVGGALRADGTSQAFYDLIRFSDAGAITLTADAGDVELLAGSLVSAAAHAAGGDAGSVTVAATQGAFLINGATLLGGAAAGQTTGRFVLDAGMLPSFTEVSGALNDGGFFEERNLRVRTGSIVIEDIGGTANVARNFTVSTDQGDITVTGTIDASGQTGGKITLAAGRNLSLESGAELTVHGAVFSSAGKGGEIRLEAGTDFNAAFTGPEDPTAMLLVKTGSTIDLGVDAFVAGDYTTPGSSAFRGQFTGKLHLRAPRLGNDIAIGPIAGSIEGASSVLAEGFRIYNRTGIGTLDTALRTQIDADGDSYLNAGYGAMHTKLLTGNPNAAGLDAVLVIAPGVEIINRTGNLALGTANTAGGAATSLHTADWDLSTFRYGPKNAPGVLTLRASGDLIFNNALSDGFNPVTATVASGHSSLWLATLMDVNAALPVNTQSWSYRFAAGADLGAADFRAVIPNAGSVLVGEFYAPVPNNSPSGLNAAVGVNGLTANTIRISINNTNAGTRYEVVRTGTGDIDIAAGRDVQLRNQFATIYTAGVRVPTPTTVFAAGDFVIPVVDLTGQVQPANLNGAVQQQYAPQWSLAGGNVSISAGADIWRTTLRQGVVIADSTGQMPANWLYRRGYVDPATGLFGVGGVDFGDPPIIDAAASTTWWIDFSNFFQGIGALGGGDIALLAGSDVVNVDAVLPTNARMPGVDPISGLNVAPDADRLLEYGGGDLTVRAGANIDGGVYYVESGTGSLFAGGVIKTNESRSPSRGILSSPPVYLDPVTWLPTTLYVGKSNFEVSARGDILIGPATNPFLLPSGLNNRYWYKTYFNTFDNDAGVDVASFGGSVTHRLGTATAPILSSWLSSKNLFTNQLTTNSSNFQPWIRLSETALGAFSTFTRVMAPTLRSTAFAGDLNIVGPMTLFPSASGTLELAASGGIIGLQPSGRTGALTTWSTASINLSDADPSLIPGTNSPFAYQAVVGRAPIPLRETNTSFLDDINQALTETGSYSDLNATVEIQQALHASSLLHRGDTQPVRLYAGGGDITGLTLFTPKAARVIAQNDITDISFYIQNLDAADISVVSAGRDIVPYNENSPLRSLASNSTLGNRIIDPLRSTVTGINTNTLAGDIQINGPGVLEVLAGRNLDLGAGPNFRDGTGVGITSIGSARNPFLPQDGADIIVLAGVSGVSGSGPALGLSVSSLDFESLAMQLVSAEEPLESAYLTKLGSAGTLADLTDEQQAIVALENFYRTLRLSGRSAVADGDYSAGTAAIELLFGPGANTGGEVLTRAREIRTTSGGAISLAVPGGGVTMASDIFGNPLAPPGVVTEFGGAISVFTDGSVNIGSARIFTLRGGNIVIWSSTGDIAAGNAPKTVVTAPPTRVVIDSTTATVQTDLGGLATGGGIGVLASVVGVPVGDVDLIAPLGVVDAGDAGIRVTGNLTIAATAVLNASNIQAAGTSAGVASTPTVSAPNLGALTSANNTNAAGASAAQDLAKKQLPQEQMPEEAPSDISVVVLGYGPDNEEERTRQLPAVTPPQTGNGSDEEEEEKKRRMKRQIEEATMAVP